MAKKRTKKTNPKKIEEYDLRELEHHMNILIFAFEQMNIISKSVKTPLTIDHGHDYHAALTQMKQTFQAYNWDLNSMFRACANPSYNLPENQPNMYAIPKLDVDIYTAKRRAEKVIYLLDQRHKRYQRKLER